MAKEDLKLKIKMNELCLLHPQDKKLILDLHRHLNGIMYAVTRWAIANRLNKKST